MAPTSVPLSTLLQPGPSAVSAIACAHQMSSVAPPTIALIAGRLQELLQSPAQSEMVAFRGEA